MTVAQLLRTEAGSRYSDVASDPATQALGTLTLAAMRQAAKCAGFENDFIVFTNEDVISTHDSIQIPTLVIHDPEDPLAPINHVDWFIAGCPSCERVSVHAAGHLIWVGPEAEIMHRTRLQFLEEHGKPAAQRGALDRDSPRTSKAK